MFLIKPPFTDPEYPGSQFYCWHCALIEGVLSYFPSCIENLEVNRIEWKRPRMPIVNLLGEANQALPVLILAKSGDFTEDLNSANGNYFSNEPMKILRLLAERHRFPEAHP
nr:DUF3088 domain-containing protein [Agrobacterium vitis]